MPLRYSKDRLKILKSVAALQRRGALDETLYRNFLRWYGKALRQLQHAEDKRPMRLSDPNLTRALFTKEAAYEAFKHVRLPETEMWAEKRARQAADLAGLQSGALTRDDVNWFAGGIASNAKILTPLFPAAPPSVVELLTNKGHEEDWLQQPGEHSFNDEMNGISPEDRKRMDADKLGYKEYKCPRCGWVHAAITREAMAERTELTERYLQCFSCRAPSADFVPAGPDDAPDGGTLQPVYVPGAWDSK